MNRAKKLQAVEELQSIFNEYDVVILAHNKGLKVSTSREIRNRVKKDAAGRYFVVKNTLAKIAVSGTSYEFLKDQFSGPTSIACSNDPTSIAKTIVKLCKDNSNLELVGGAIRGEALGIDSIKRLASLPSLDELRGKIIGLLTASAGQLISILQAPSSQVVRVIDAYSKNSN